MTSTRKIVEGVEEREEEGGRREGVERVYTAIVSPTVLKWHWPYPPHTFSASCSKFKHCKIFVSSFCKLM